MTRISGTTSSPMKFRGQTYRTSIKVIRERKRRNTFGKPMKGGDRASIEKSKALVPKMRKLLLAQMKAMKIRRGEQWRRQQSDRRRR